MLFLQAITQGITEVLPISSSLHLQLISRYFELDHPLYLVVALHLGSFIGIMVYYWRDLIRMLVNIKVDFYWLKLGVSTVPCAIVGILIKLFGIESMIRSESLVAFNIAIFSVLLIVSELSGSKSKTEFSFIHAAFIGLFQIFALLPGASRLGVTISAALLLGFKRAEAFKYSMLMSLPIILASSIGELEAIIVEPLQLSKLIIMTGVATFITLLIMEKNINRLSFSIFGYYRLLLVTFFLSW